MTTEIATFDYGQLDAPIAEFLRTKERNMREIVGKAYTELGRELKEAQEALSRNGYGCFDAWCSTLGFSKRTATNLLQRFELFAQILPEQHALIEDLPVSLSYEIASPAADKSAPKRAAKSAVLMGDIKTLKEYRELVTKLEAEEAARKAAEARIAEVADENEVLRGTVESLAAAPPRIETVTEHVPDPIISDRLKRYEAKFGDIDGEPTEYITNHTEVDGAAAHFADDIQSFLLNYAHLTTFRAAFVGITDASYDNYRTSLDALKEFVNGMERVLNGTPRGKAEVIDIAEYSRAK